MSFTVGFTFPSTMGRLTGRASANFRIDISLYDIIIWMEWFIDLNKFTFWNYKIGTGWNNTGNFTALRWLIANKSITTFTLYTHNFLSFSCHQGGVTWVDAFTPIRIYLPSTPVSPNINGIFKEVHILVACRVQQASSTWIIGSELQSHCMRWQKLRLKGNWEYMCICGF